MLTKDNCKNIVDLAVKHAGSRVDAIEVLVSGSNIATSRFANNAITQNQAPEKMRLSVRVMRGHKQTRLETDHISKNGIHALVDNAVAAVDLIADDPTVLGLPDPELTKTNRPEDFSRYNSRTAKMKAETRSDAIKSVTETAKAHGLKAAGIFTSGGYFHALGNSDGLFLHHEESAAECSITMVSHNSTGWAKEHSTIAATIDAALLAEEAAEKANKSADPKEIAPGKYTVILPPAAVLDLLIYLWPEFTGTSHVDKLSSLLGKVGTKIFGENITIRDDVYHPLQSGAPFDGEGLPRSAVTLVEKGVLKNLVYGRKSAKKLGAKPTGHGLSEPNPLGELPVNIVMEGGHASLDEMVKSTERGVLLTRVWYVRLVDPSQVLITGMTRDGTFLVEDGKVKHGVKNMRFNISVLDLFNNVIELGSPVRAAGEEALPAIVPAMKVRDFNFSSTTKF